MKNITLKEFLLRYNFRRPLEKNNIELFSTSIVRIYKDQDKDIDDWIEYGLYDFSSMQKKTERLDSSLNKELLDREVSYYYFDEDEEIFCIFLS